MMLLFNVCAWLSATRKCIHVHGTVYPLLHSSFAGEVLYTAHCGDSRAVLCRAGRSVRLSEDHKPNLPAERERIRQARGRIDFSNCWRVIVEPRGGRPGSGLAVSRSFGDLAFKQPCRSVPTLAHALHCSYHSEQAVHIDLKRQSLGSFCQCVLLASGRMCCTTAQATC